MPGSLSSPLQLQKNNGELKDVIYQRAADLLINCMMPGVNGQFLFRYR